MLSCSASYIIHVFAFHVVRTMESVRKRQPNYSQFEKNLLLDIVRNYKSIIESKKTDKFVNRDKQEAWILVAEAFNAQNTNGIRRDESSLKKML